MVRYYYYLILWGLILKKKRIIYIDVIRLFAMLLVILAHSCAAVLGLPKHDSNWQMANSIVVITEVAVPLFFMISGAVILNSSKTSSLKYLFKHRLTRIVVPFLVWSVISAFGNSAINARIHTDPIDTLLKMFHQPVLVTYWFIYPLITFYLLSPLMKAMVERLDDGVLTYGLMLWFIFIIVLPAVTRSVPRDIGMYFDSAPESKVIISEWVGYFLLGYRLTRERHLHVNLWITIPLIIALMAEKIYISFSVLDPSVRYLNIISAAILPIVVILIYLSLRALEPHYPHWFAWIIEFMAPLTYGIYLMHGITVLTLQRYLGYTNYWMSFGMTVGISVVTIAILHYIPFIRRLFT